jgi:hypothetical protein
MVEHMDKVRPKVDDCRDAGARAERLAWAMCEATLTGVSDEGWINVYAARPRQSLA